MKTLTEEQFNNFITSEGIAIDLEEFYRHAHPGKDPTPHDKFGKPLNGVVAFGGAKRNPMYTTLAAFDGSMTVDKKGKTIYDLSEPRLERLDLFVQDEAGYGSKWKKEQYPLLADVLPNYIIRTCEGNYQAGWFLDGGTLEVAKELMRRANATPGAGDPGAFKVTQKVRLPLGINGKQRKNDETGHWEPIEGLYDQPVELVYWNPEPRHDAVMFADAMGFNPVPQYSRHLNTLKARNVPTNDKVIKHLYEREMVVRENADGSLDVQCPWEDEHSAGGARTARYYPPGVGRNDGELMARGFNCFHGHCENRRGHDVVMWCVDNGMELLHESPEAEVLLERYCYIINGGLVGDMDGTGRTTHLTFKRENWVNAHKMRVNTESGQMAVSAAWEQSRNRMVCRGVDYRPGEPVVVDMGADGRMFNIYRDPVHEEVEGEPDVFLEHVAHVIPIESQRERFFDWLAHKVQFPASRSYAVNLIADAGYAADGETFGIGRSMIAKIIAALYHNNGAKFIELDQVLEQQQFNEHMRGVQFLFLEEAMDGRIGVANGRKRYEALKQFVDTSPTRVTINAKFQQKEEMWAYFNVLIASNHSDALVLPPDDRRLMVIKCSTERRSRAELDKVWRYVLDEQLQARLWWWLKRRDVSRFDPFMPMVTEAKRVMAELSKTADERVIDEMLRQCKGDLISGSDWRELCRKVLTDIFDGEVSDKDHKHVLKSARKFFLDRPKFEKNGREMEFYLDDEHTHVRVRPVRNVGEWMKFDLGVDTARARVRKEARKNVSLALKSGKLGRKTQDVES